MVDRQPIGTKIQMRLEEEDSTPTWIPDHMTLCLELLHWDRGSLRKNENVPIHISHSELLMVG